MRGSGFYIRKIGYVTYTILKNRFAGCSKCTGIGFNIRTFYLDDRLVKRYKGLHNERYTRTYVTK